MERTEPASPRARRPWVVIVATVFLGYAAFVALPMLVLGPQNGFSLTAVQIGLSFAAFSSLGLLGRWQPTFHLVRVTLALWAVRAVYTAWHLIGAPWFSTTARPQPLLIQIVMALGAGALCCLFCLYGFGRRSRAFYGLTPGKG